jgi:hypothetical protein
MVSEPNLRGENIHAAKKARGQRGGAGLKTVIWLLVLASFFYVCFKIVPSYFANYQFEDWLRTQIPFFMINHTSDDSLRAAILKEIQLENIPATEDSIHIIQNTPAGVNVQVDYTVNIDLMVYQTKLHFTPQMNSQSLVQ